MHVAVTEPYTAGIVHIFQHGPTPKTYILASQEDPATPPETPTVIDDKTMFIDIKRSE